MLLDGQRLAFDVPPLVVNDTQSTTILVPLRVIFEALSANIDWNQKTMTVTAIKGDNIIKLVVGDTSPTVNGLAVTISHPGIIVDGRTLVPLRFVSEAFGASVNWDNATFTVTIKS